MADETFTTSVMIDCSTAHITQRDSELLADQDAMPMAVYDIPYGFLVYLGIDLIEGADELMRKEGLSEAFITLVQKGRASGAQFMRLDEAGEVYDWLEQFDW
jgi:hypothetical protein